MQTEPLLVRRIRSEEYILQTYSYGGFLVVVSETKITAYAIHSQIYSKSGSKQQLCSLEMSVPLQLTNLCVSCSCFSQASAILYYSDRKSGTTVAFDLPNAVVLGVLDGAFDDLHVGPGDYLYCTKAGLLRVFTNELVEVARIDLKPGENICPVGTLSDKYMVALFEEHSLRLCGMSAAELEQPMEPVYLGAQAEPGNVVVLGS